MTQRIMQITLQDFLKIEDLLLQRKINFQRQPLPLATDACNVEQRHLLEETACQAERR